MGEVYKAYDPRLDRTIALKFLLNDTTENEDAHQRFIHEARATSALDHPNICTIYDIGEAEDGRTFIAMAYYEGETLRARMSTGPLPVEDAIDVSVQIAEGLRQVHRRGIVHRDIKPANIFITEEGLVKILDFGLAKMRAVDLTREASTMGTAAYMSPEQARGEEVDQRTDIWSLGIIMYEMLTGRRPFRGDYWQALLYAILHEEVEALSTHIQDLDKGFELVVEKALSKAASDRYDSMDALLEDLQEAKGMPFEAAAFRTPAMERHAVGRGNELDALNAGLQRVYAGSGLLVGVAGEAGIGKTTVVEEFLTGVAVSGIPALIARGQCSERLAGTEAYLPFFDILGHLLQQDRDGSVGRLMREKAPWWYVQVASLSPDDPSNQRILEHVRNISQEQVKRELATFLREVSTNRPLIAFFEDLHWADVSSVDLIAYLSARFDGMKVMIVTTYRPVEMQLGDHPFLKIKPDLVSRNQCREITLQFLSSEDIEAYLELEYPDNDFPEELVGVIHRRTEGSPLFMADLIRDFVQRGVIKEVDGVWKLIQTLKIVQQELPDSVKAMIERKIDQLNEGDQRLMMVASVQGFEFDSAVLASVLKQDEEAVEERLQALERDYRFVEMTGEDEFPDRTLTLKYRFVHVLYQNNLYETLTRTKRVRLCRLVAETLEDFYGEKVTDVASNLARLFAAARQYERAVDYYSKAAAYVYSVFAYKEALSLAGKGLEYLELIPESSARDRLELSLQNTIGASLTATRGYGHEGVGKAYRRVRELYKGLEFDLESIAFSYGLWSYSICICTPELGLELASEHEQLARREDNKGLLAIAHSEFGGTRQQQGQFAASKTHYDHAIQLYLAGVLAQKNISTLGNMDLLSHDLNHLSFTLWALGYPDQAIDTLNKSEQRIEELDSPFVKTHYLGFAGWVYQSMGDEAMVMKVSEANIAISEDNDFPVSRAWAAMLQGWVQAERGFLEEGLDLLRNGLSVWRGSGMLAMVPYWHSLIVPLLGKLRAYEEGLVLIDEAMDIIESTNHRWFESDIHRLKGDIRLLQHAPEEEVAGHYENALTVARAQEAKSYELRAAMSLIKLWKKQGKEQEAVDLLGGVYNWFTEGFDTADLIKAGALLDELQTR